MSTPAIGPRGVEPVAPAEQVAREIRAELGRQQLSNRRLALMLGVSREWVNRRITTGATEITINDVQRFADVLHVPATRLLAGWLPRVDSNHQPAGSPIAPAGYPTRHLVAA
jgi:transcriptional regulator with XRE-family HTH domain